MNLRENHLAALRLQPCQRTPRWELGFWSGAIQRWYDEGLPGNEQTLRARESYGSWVSSGGIGVGLNGRAGREHDVSRFLGWTAASPALTSTTTPARPTPAKCWTRRTSSSSAVMASGSCRACTNPSWACRSGSTTPSTTGRSGSVSRPSATTPAWHRGCPATGTHCWPSTASRDYPLALGGGATGYFGSVRQILGLERTLTTLCDDPAWMHDMFDYLADFYVTLYDQVLTQIKPDLGVHWEDMCYVAGPLISPRMFREFMLKPYQKLSGLLRDHGVDILMVDTDGDCRKLIPLFMEGGVTALYPFEVQSHMDVAEIRRQYPAPGIAGRH